MKTIKNVYSELEGAHNLLNSCIESHPDFTPYAQRRSHRNERSGPYSGGSGFQIPRAPSFPPPARLQGALRTQDSGVEENTVMAVEGAAEFNNEAEENTAEAVEVAAEFNNEAEENTVESEAVEVAAEFNDEAMLHQSYDERL